MGAHRQSALLLHGLGYDDQHWILERLDESDRATLEAHLGELKSLGIPPAPALAAAAAAPRQGGPVATLMAASAARMGELLAGEPVWLLRHLLALGQWPWRDAWLATLAPERRVQVTAARPQPLARAAAERLLADIAAGVGEVSPVLQPVRRPGALQALRHAMARWK